MTLALFFCQTDSSFLAEFSYSFMASSSNHDSSHSHNTMFVQADPSNFRTIVQKLTGAPSDPSTQKFPLTHQSRDLAPKRPPFKLHERRQSAKNLQIQLNKTSCNYNNETVTTRPQPNLGFFKNQQQLRVSSSFLVSPVSTLDFISAHASPRSCDAIEEGEEEEQRMIKEKGFYLHPSPRSGEPELLTLFPLHSPKDNNASVDNDCSS